MFRKSPRYARERGVALIMVLCALFLLSMIVFGLAQRLNQQTFLEGRDDRELDARALAYSGLQIALHPMASFKTPALHRQIDKQHRFDARILGEGGKLNLNWLLAGEDQRKIAILKQYLNYRGLDFQQREVLTDCMLDWVKPGNTTHLNGSRTGLDGLPVPGRPFEDISEIKRIVGSEPLTKQLDWDRDFTLLSKGPIDLQWASAEVVASLPGVGLSVAQNFVRVRRGEDGKDGTADDRELDQNSNPGMAQALLNLAPADYQALLQTIVTFGDPTVRIVAAGQAVDVVRTFEVVARKEGMQPQILSWKEM
jgi:type II secretory pathway component PulK